MYKHFFAHFFFETSNWKLVTTNRISHQNTSPPIKTELILIDRTSYIHVFSPNSITPNRCPTTENGDKSRERQHRRRLSSDRSDSEPYLDPTWEHGGCMWAQIVSIVDRVLVSVAAVLSARFKRWPVGISHI